MSIKLARQLFLPAIAAALLIFATLSSLRPAAGRTDAVIAPPEAPYANNIAGVGVVEPESEVISIATELAGVAREILVRPGDEVRAGDVLFSIDDRALAAALAEAEAAEAAARANAAVAAVAVEDERQRYSLYKSIADKRAVSENELDRSRFAVSKAQAALTLAEAEINSATAKAASIRTDLDRLNVKAPIDGKIFSVDIRPGEFAAAGPLSIPLITMGAAETLHLRVEIDEADIAGVSAKAKASATVRDRADKHYPLRFVRFEPRATAKKALAGGSERVDSRVVEIIYALPAGSDAIVGQRMDAYIDAEPLTLKEATS